jgi:hypothetical protein
MAKPPDARKIAQSGFKRLTHHNAGIFDRVMHINMQVALRRNRQVNQRMLGKAFEHMIKKANASRNFRCACPIQIHGDRDLRFFGIALNGGRPHDEIFPLLVWVSAPMFGASGPS